MFKRYIYHIVKDRLSEPRKRIQAITGPRQVGKTTAVQQVASDLDFPVIYATADQPLLDEEAWLGQQWELARQQTKALRHGQCAVLVLDEIQKIPAWSNQVKYYWDEDTHKKIPLQVVLLGSAPLLMQHDLTESLAGRFEQIQATHWSYQEMREAFDWTLNQYLYFGGYPGSASLVQDEERWRRYINDSLIETTLSRDILMQNVINKPILLRRLFELSCYYSSQILSYQKILGQLHDAGNTTTLAHYLQILQSVSMVGGLEKFSNHIIRQRGSSPKLHVFNTALMSATVGLPFEQVYQNKPAWGRLVESAVGAYLLNEARLHGMSVYYWREGNTEVDFVVAWRKQHIAIEVKSGVPKETQSGLQKFVQQYKPVKTLLIGGQNLSVESFLLTPLTTWFEFDECNPCTLRALG